MHPKLGVGRERSPDVFAGCCPLTPQLPAGTLASCRPAGHISVMPFLLGSSAWVGLHQGHGLPEVT